jgi:hypothetical protein
MLGAMNQARRVSYTYSRNIWISSAPCEIAYGWAYLKSFRDVQVVGDDRIKEVVDCRFIASQGNVSAIRSHR